MSLLLIFRPVKNRQVYYLAVQSQGKAGDLPGVQIKFVKFKKILSTVGRLRKEYKLPIRIIFPDHPDQGWIEIGFIPVENGNLDVIF